MKKTVLIICLVTLVIFSSKSVKACSCMDDLPNAFLELEESDAVFIGQVLDAKEVEVPSSDNDGSFYYQLEVRLSVERILKGVEGKEVILHTGSRCCDCGFGFKKGEKYLVYAYQYKGALKTSYCTRTKPLANAAKDLEEIRKGQKEKKKLKAKRVSATKEKYNNSQSTTSITFHSSSQSAM